MRLIGHLPAEGSARTFGDFLYVQGIDNQLEHDQEGGWGIWIHDEDRIQEALRLLQGFRAAPDDPAYRTQAKDAQSLRDDRKKKEQAYLKRVHDRRGAFRPLTGYGIGPLTIALVLASACVYVLSSFGKDPRIYAGLLISNYYDSGLEEVRHGQIWRLITPIFIHANFLHILFNMLWLRDLGGMIEARQGTLYLSLLVVVLAVSSNLGQYIVSGPAFGGMSGVVYGLLGYVWIRGKFDPGSGLYLHPTTVTMMLIWFFVCLVGIVPGVANATHAVGLGLGCAWGYVSSQRRFRH